MYLRVCVYIYIYVYMCFCCCIPVPHACSSHLSFPLHMLLVALVGIPNLKRQIVLVILVGIVLLVEVEVYVADHLRNLALDQLQSRFSAFALEQLNEDVVVLADVPTICWLVIWIVEVHAIDPHERVSVYCVSANSPSLLANTMRAHMTEVVEVASPLRTTYLPADGVEVELQAVWDWRRLWGSLWHMFHRPRHRHPLRFSPGLGPIILLPAL